MTTIISDLRDGSVYTDSRSTILYETGIFWKKEHIVGFEKSMKVFKIKGLLCARVGDVLSSNKLMRLIQDGNFHIQYGRIIKGLKNHAGGVVITRKNYCIVVRVNDKGKVTREVHFGSDSIRTFGSGNRSAILRNISNNLKSKDILVKDVIVRVMKFNSLFDKYSDDEVVYSNQTLEHWVYK